MIRKKTILIIGISVFSILIIYVFLFGKLFAYSPVFPGFEKHVLSHTVFYHQDKAIFDDYIKIDTLIPSIENFHELKFITKPKIFLFSDSISYIRHSLTKARFCAFYNGRVFVTPWALREAQAGEISLEIYLTHELSHSLIHQHSGLMHAYKYPEWLLEGIAMYSANQMGTSFYPDKKETYRLIKAGNFMPPDYFRTKNEDKIKLDVEYRITFMYSEFGCIVDYMITTYGKDKFISYMKSLIKNNDHDNLFRQIYGIDFDEFLDDFKEYVSLNTPE